MTGIYNRFPTIVLNALAPYYVNWNVVQCKLERCTMQIGTVAHLPSSLQREEEVAQNNTHIYTTGVYMYMCMYIYNFI